MDFKSLINKISKDFEIIIKDEISSKGLIDTGSLINSVRASIRFTGNKFEIDVEGNDYFKFLDDDYNIIRDALNSSKIKQIEKKLEDAYEVLIEEEITKKLK